MQPPKIDLGSTPEILCSAQMTMMMTKLCMRRKSSSQSLNSLREEQPRIYKTILSMQAKTLNFSIRESLLLKNKIDQKTPLAIQLKLSKIHKGVVIVLI